MQASESTTVEISANLQDKLERLRMAFRLPTCTAMLELLISMQIDSSVYQMTGIKPGPKLAIDNTTTPAEGTKENHVEQRHA